MTLEESFALVIYGLVGAGFLWWYVWCWWTMMFRCQKPSHFFSEAYSTSEVFAIVNAIALLCAAAFALFWITN